MIQNQRKITISFTRIFLVVFILFVTIINGKAQPYLYDILDIKHQEVDVIQKIEKDSILFLETGFTASAIINKKDISRLIENAIIQIDLVYTTFKESDTFNQRELNYQRLRSLKKDAPFLFESDIIIWKVIAQTACSSASEGDNFFHGFRIKYIPAPTAISMAKEIEYIEKVLEPFEPIVSTAARSEIVRKKSTSDDRILSGGLTIEDIRSDITSFITSFDKTTTMNIHSLMKEKYDFESIRKQKDLDVVIDFDIIDNSEVVISMGDSAADIVKQSADIIVQIVEDKLLTISGHYSFRIIKQNGKLCLSMYDKEFAPATDYLCRDRSVLESGLHSVDSESLFLMDSTIIKTFERNKDWDRMAIVCDLTGSMAPYTSQLLIWQLLNFKSENNKVLLFTFFNDGDQKSTNSKHVGSTGGVYSGIAETFDELKDLIVGTMRKGGGGDCPENNIEALLKAIEECPGCQDIVMIADNYATPRDLSLVSKITKPVKIILCGTYAGINSNYMDIARLTGGTIHTIEEDITRLKDLSEGEEVSIAGKKYKIVNGRFVPLTRYGKVRRKI